MSDVMVRFIKDPPRKVKLRGEWWSLSIVPTNKSGKRAVLLASCATDHREHSLTSGSPSSIRDSMAKGFFVRSGTPARGLVTELRRAGIVVLEAHRVPKEGDWETV